MRRLCSRLMALGLAAGLLAVVPNAAQAGKPKCPHSTGSYKCPSCQVADAQRKAGNRPIVISGAAPIELSAPGCASCAASGGGVVMMHDGEAPGVAHLGGAHPGGVVMPGAGVLASHEPAPIGVVRPSYDQNARPTAFTGGAAGFDPTHGPSRAPSMMSAGMGMGMPPGAIPPAPTPMDSQARRTSVLGHLFGLDGLGRLGEGRAARQASQHAAIPMGAPAAAARPNALPASMVYGR